MNNFQFQCLKHLMFPWLLTSSSHHVRGSPDQPIYDEKTLYPEKNDAGKKSMVAMAVLAMLTMVAMVELAAHMCRSILYVIVFIIVLCQRWWGVDDCVVLDVEGAGLETSKPHCRLPWPPPALFLAVHIWWQWSPHNILLQCGNRPVNEPMHWCISLSWI